MSAGQETSDPLVQRTIDQLLPERPELSEEGRQKMRDKARMIYASNRLLDAHGDKSDEWVANAVYMLRRNDLDHSAIVQAGRDRIMQLSLAVETLQARIKELEHGR